MLSYAVYVQKLWACLMSMLSGNSRYQFYKFHESFTLSYLGSPFRLSSMPKKVFATTDVLNSILGIGIKSDCVAERPAKGSTE